MRYKDEQYVLDTLDDIRKETHENNIMFRRIIKVINTWIKHHPQENTNDFNMNVIANLISNLFKTGRLSRGF